ncbi:hypothetical protein [Ottowia sp.]|uniref:hypothetical protein n=1 Tax=Ottowia sp. TaxID=1898956 RepID=UPI00263406DB|nr:hypothetical protein [Ottowia sp.]
MKTRAQTILADLYAAGIEVNLSENGCDLKVLPKALTPKQRAALKEHKAAVVALLHSTHYAAGKLIAAAMRACDELEDSPSARDQMLREVLAVPPHLRADLACCIEKTYPERPGRRAVPSGARTESRHSTKQP